MIAHWGCYPAIIQGPMSRFLQCLHSQCYSAQLHHPPRPPCATAILAECQEGSCPCKCGNRRPKSLNHSMPQISFDVSTYSSKAPYHVHPRQAGTYTRQHMNGCNNSPTALTTSAAGNMPCICGAGACDGLQCQVALDWARGLPGWQHLTEGGPNKVQNSTCLHAFVPAYQ